MISDQRQSFVGGVIAISGALIACLLPLIFERGYYFHNDVQHYFMPMIHEIGSRLSHGEWPILTLRSMYAGNLVGEGQFGLFNPVTLAVYWFVSKISNLQDGALLYACIHVGVIAAGIYSLARLLTLSTHMAAMVAITATTSGMMSYVEASMWWNAITTNAWLVWALRNWLSFITRGRSLIAAIITTAFVFAGGWPHGSLALGIVVLVVLCVKFGRDAKVVRYFVLAGIVLGVLLSLPALVALAAQVIDGAREAVNGKNGSVGTMTLDGLLAISWPTYIPGNTQFVIGSPTFPVAYGGWFVVPVLIVFYKQFLIHLRTSRTLQSLVIIALIFGVLTFGPSYLGPLRWPVRFIWYFQLALILISGYVLDRIALRAESPALRWGVIIWLGAAFLSWQQSPESIHAHLIACGLGLLGTIHIITSASVLRRAVGMAAVTLCIHAYIHSVWWRNDNVIHFLSPENVTVSETLVNQPNALFLQGYQRYYKFYDWRLLPSGNIVLWQGGNYVNGYTPIQPTGLKDMLCFNDRSYVCHEAAKNLFQVDPFTGLDLASLLRIGAIHAERGQLARDIEQIAPDHGFKLVAQSALTETWQRDIKTDLGTLSYTCPSLEVKLSGEATVLNERFSVANKSSHDCLLVWARTAFPGYEVKIDNDTLEVSPYLNTLISVKLPPGKSGLLSLSFMPAGWRITFPLALAALLMTFLLSAAYARYWGKNKV